MADSCRYVYKGIQQQYPIILEPPLLQLLEGWYQPLLYLENFRKYVFMRYYQTFLSLSPRDTEVNVYVGHINTSTRLLMNGAVFSPQMDSGLVSREIIHVVSFGEIEKKKLSSIKYS